MKTTKQCATFAMLIALTSLHAFGATKPFKKVLDSVRRYAPQESEAVILDAATRQSESFRRLSKQAKGINRSQMNAVFASVFKGRYGTKNGKDVPVQLIIELASSAEAKQVTGMLETKQDGMFGTYAEGLQLVQIQRTGKAAIDESKNYDDGLEMPAAPIKSNIPFAGGFYMGNGKRVVELGTSTKVEVKDGKYYLVLDAGSYFGMMYENAVINQWSFDEVSYRLGTIGKMIADINATVPTAKIGIATAKSRLFVDEGLKD